MSVRSAIRFTRDIAEQMAFAPRRKRKFAQSQKGPAVRRTSGMNGKALPNSRERKRDRRRS